MANVHGALKALGAGLGDMVNLEANREHERVMAMRQENLMRISASLNEQSRENDRAFDSKERKLDRDAASGVEISRVEQGNLDRQASATQHRESVQVQREGNQLQADNIALQNRRYDESTYVESANRIDKRIQDVNDYLTQATAEGKVMDEASLAPYKQELSQLQEQKQLMARDRDIQLARSGDARYRKLSTAEVAQLSKKDQPPKPAAPTVAAQAARETPQGSTIKAVPRAPEKPPGMRAREERKLAGKSFAPDNARSVETASASREAKLRESLAGKDRLDLELMLRKESDGNLKSLIRERLAEISRSSTRELLPSNHR